MGTNWAIYTDKSHLALAMDVGQPTSQPLLTNVDWSVVDTWAHDTEILERYLFGDLA